MGQWNRIESLNIDPYKYNQLIFGKGTKTLQWSKDSFHKWCLNNWTITCKKMNLHPELRLFIKTNSNWIIDLHADCKAVKLLEGNIGEKI